MLAIYTTAEPTEEDLVEAKRDADLTRHDYNVASLAADRAARAAQRGLITTDEAAEQGAKATRLWDLLWKLDAGARAVHAALRSGPVDTIEIVHRYSDLGTYTETLHESGAITYWETRHVGKVTHSSGLLTNPQREPHAWTYRVVLRVDGEPTAQVERDIHPGQAAAQLAYYRRTHGV